MKAVNGLKKCSKCGEVKEVEEFSKNSSSIDGYKCSCRTCRNVEAANYRASEYGKLIKKKYVENNKDRIKEIRSRYRENNKEKIRQSKSEYRENNKDKIVAYRRNYNSENRSNLKYTRRAYRAANKDRINELNKRYRDKYIASIHDSYVKTAISNGFNIPFHLITLEMIEVKRLQLTNKRFIKKLKQCKASKI